MLVIEKTIIDSERKMAYGFKFNGHLSVNANVNVEKTIIRDPGEFVELELSKDNVSASVRIEVNLNVQEEFEKQSAENPLIAAFLELLMIEATKNYVFQPAAEITAGKKQPPKQ